MTMAAGMKTITVRAWTPSALPAAMAGVDKGTTAWA